MGKHLDLKTMLVVALTAAVSALVTLLITDNGSHKQQVQRDKRGLTAYHRRQVKNTIRREQNSVKSCYQNYTNSQPAISEGQVLVDFEIGPDGRVQRAGIIQSAFQDGAAFHECLLSAIRGWKFPKPTIPPPVYAEHRFRFHDVQKAQEKGK